MPHTSHPESDADALPAPGEMHRILFDHSPDAIFLSIPNGKILEANAAACRMFGMTEDELIARGRSGLFAPDDPRGEALVQKRAQDGKVFGEAGFLRKDGSRFTAELSSVIVEDGCRAFVILRDISDRIRSEAFLRQESEKLRHFYELCPLGISLRALSTGRFVFFNDAMLASTGYSDEEFRLLGIEDLIPPDDLDRETQELRHLRETGRFGPLEKEYLRKDGSRFPVMVNGALVRDEAGNEFLWSVVQDFSERKQLEQRLVEAANASKSGFPADMSHETLAPMDGDRERSLSAGMGGSLATPLHSGELARPLDRWLDFEAGDTGPENPPSSQEDADDPAPGDLPVLERAGFLQRVPGDQLLADETIRLFLSDTPARIQSVAGAIAFGRFVLATDAAHAIKGAATTIGAKALCAVARQVEAAASAHDAQAMTALLPELKHQFARLQAEFQEAPSENAAGGQ